MRGKNILWLSLIAMLFSTMMVTLVSAQACTILVDPAEVHNEDMLIESFTVDINVQDAVDLYSYAFTLKFAPYVRTLVCSVATEGDFLEEEGIDTDFVYAIDPFHGEVKVGNARLGQVPGVSGSGTIATVAFTVVEAGESPLDLLDVELYDSTGALIDCDIVNGKYFGPKADVWMSWIKKQDGWWWWWPFAFAGDTITATSWVKNYGEVPLYTKVQYELVRHDGRVTSFWAGQSYVTTVKEPVYLYVNEYNEFYEWDWTNPGASVIGEPDGNYAESIVADAISSSYGFEDLTLEEGDAINRVVLEGYCQYPNGATDAVDIDIYTVPDFAWLGSLYGSDAWGWVTPRWIGTDVSDELPELLGKNTTALNNLEVLMYNYEGNEDNPMRVDALRLRVEFAQAYPIAAPVFTVEPGEMLKLDPATWALAVEDVGFYRGTATCYYSYNGIDFIPGERPNHVWLWVWKPWPWW